jgi:hypothetical protein
VTPFGVTTTDTFQYQFELATGTCTIVYDVTTYGGASAWHTPLFGYTAGNASYAESLDMSAAQSHARHVRRAFGGFSVVKPLSDVDDACVLGYHCAR